MQTLKLFFVFIFVSTALQGQIVLEQAKDAAIPIAIQPFLRSAETPDVVKAATDIEAQLTANLIFSRLFKPLPVETFLEPTVKGAIETLQVGSWRQVGADFVARAKVSKEGPTLKLEGYLFKIKTGALTVKKTYTTSRSDITILSNMFGDDIVEAVTGEKGLFSTKIAFAYLPPGARFKEIWVMDFNGRHPEPLIRNGRTNLSPVWTLDGRSLFFTSASQKSWHLWKADLRGGSRQVTNFEGSALGPNMLPNGREIVISLSKDGNPELYIIDLNGRPVRRLTRSSEMDISPSINPDGTQLCYSSGRLGALHVFVMNIASGAAERRTRVGTLNDSCAWHPKKNQILFSGMDTDKQFDIFSMNSEGNDMERLTYDAKNNETPNWSPDGNLVVFSSRRSGRDEIYVMKADGSQMTKITELPGGASQPTWSPRLGY